MSQLLISQTQITFQPKETMKSIQLTNLIQAQTTGQPIMYKIKTNKIDYVDAKPSCGYISGKQGQNEISVVIRSLNNKKSYTAKLQILYIAHDKITEELVEKNRKHFDINQYNQIYQTIKSASKNDAKSSVINVIKKIQDNAQEEPIQQHFNKSDPSIKVQNFTQAKRASTPRQKDTITIEKNKLLNLSLFMLIVGLLIGFWLGCKHGGIFYSHNDRNVNQIETASANQPQVFGYVNVQAPSETQQQSSQIKYEQNHQRADQLINQPTHNQNTEPQDVVQNDKQPLNQQVRTITESQQEMQIEEEQKQLDESQEVQPQKEEAEKEL